MRKGSAEQKARMQAHSDRNSGEGSGTRMACMQIRLLITGFFISIEVGPVGRQHGSILLAISSCNYMSSKGIEASFLKSIPSNPNSSQIETQFK